MRKTAPGSMQTSFGSPPLRVETRCGRNLLLCCRWFCMATRLDTYESFMQEQIWQAREERRPTQGGVRPDGVAASVENCARHRRQFTRGWQQSDVGSLSGFMGRKSQCFRPIAQAPALWSAAAASGRRASERCRVRQLHRIVDNGAGRLSLQTLEADYATVVYTCGASESGKKPRSSLHDEPAQRPQQAGTPTFAASRAQWG